MERYCEKYILDDLKRKMVFIGGPRQVGKTTLSRRIAKDHNKSEYFNWDVTENRLSMLKHQWPNEAALVVFDELHKYPRWKSWIKGVYDIRAAHQQYLVTGSARLDVYRRGGDSLLGRYHYWRLHPFTLDELPPDISPIEGYQRLLTLGGFPEPFLLGDERQARRWRRERFERILYEDVRDLTLIRNLQLLSLMVEALRERAGGLITLSNLAQDLEISPKTAKAWLSLLEKMYIGFAVYPFTKNMPRALQKAPKFYFFDNADVINNPGGSLENLVASHLLKRLHFIEDYHGYRCELRYIRDKEGREVDFLTIVDNQIIDLIEVKSSDKTISSALKYYAQKLKPKRVIQLVGNLTRRFEQDNIEVMHPIDYFNQPYV